MTSPERSSHSHALTRDTSFRDCENVHLWCFVTTAVRKEFILSFVPMLQSKAYTSFPRIRKFTGEEYFCTIASLRQLHGGNWRPLPLTQLKEGPWVGLDSLPGKQTNDSGNWGCFLTPCISVQVETEASFLI